MIWQEFEAAAPRLAGLGRERFERDHLALIGTLRAEGSPRISPVEPYLVLGHLLLGFEWPTSKARDLRDPRCTLHSTVTDPTARREFGCPVARWRRQRSPMATTGLVAVDSRQVPGLWVDIERPHPLGPRGRRDDARPMDPGHGRDRGATPSSGLTEDVVEATGVGWMAGARP
jgi:hypothetical protein